MQRLAELRIFETISCVNAIMFAARAGSWFVPELQEDLFGLGLKREFFARVVVTVIVVIPCCNGWHGRSQVLEIFLGTELCIFGFEQFHISRITVDVVAEINEQVRLPFKNSA